MNDPANLSNQEAEEAATAVTASLSSPLTLINTSTSFKSGTLLNDTYRLERVLGQGGMGEVWLATHMVLDQPRAIKLMLSKYAADPLNRRRFVRGEAYNALRLQHPNIVRVYEVSHYQGLLYIVMEYIEGGDSGPDLKSLLRAKGALGLPETGQFLQQLAAALDNAHSLGIIHRDLKPANVLVTPAGQLKLSDFGLVKDLSDEAEADLTMAGYAVGTPLYMAPEQALGQTEAASDIYALGVLVYEMLTGQPPFTGNTQSLLLQHATVVPRPPDQLNPVIPARLGAVILKALAKRPAERYSTAQQMAEAYWQALDGGVDSSIYETTPLNVTPSAVATTAVTPHNLPDAPNALLGRERDLAELCRMLCSPNLRLLTLSGSGGLGKTRLSLEVARALLSDFPDGVYFVPLENVTDEEMLVQALAQTLQVKEAPDQSLLQTLGGYLQTRRSLLVLDNFEQIVQCGPLLLNLLKAAPGLKLLVTSRVILQISLEKEYRLEPLALPQTSYPLSESLSQWRQSPAIVLFAERAQTARPNFSLSVENIEAVAEICRRLDGLPLAIELAAARVKVLNPAQILQRLTSSLKLLTGGANDLPSRQQTLRSAIDWSYELLNEAEKKLFRRLAVFADGCTLESAEQVCNAAADLEIEVLEGLESLVNKSLLFQREGADGGVRLGLLQTIREYALEKLAERGELAELERQLVAYYLTFARAAQIEVTNNKMPPAPVLAEVATEINNWRKSLDILQQLGEWSALAELVEVVWCCWWYQRSYHSEAEGWLKLLLDRPEQIEAARYVRLLFSQRLINWVRGEFEQTQALDNLILQKYSELDNKMGVAQTFANIAATDIYQGNYSEAVTYCEKCLVILKDMDSQVVAAVAGLAANDLGVALFNLGDYARAEQVWQENLALWNRHFDPLGASQTLINLGNIALHRSQYEQAEDLYNQGLKLCEELGFKRGRAVVLRNLGHVAMARQHYELAENLYRQSLKLRWECEEKLGVASSLEALAYALLAQTRYSQALPLYAAANCLRTAIKAARPPFEQHRYDTALAKLCKLLGQAHFEKDWAAACQLPLPQVVTGCLAGVF